MADTPLPQPDLTLLSGSIAEMGRDQRLLRLQVDNIAARLASHDQRFTAIDSRLATVEQSIHGLTSETARGFGQQQQQLTRIEQRLDAVQAGLTGIGAALAENTRLLADFLARS
jgi:uncharacterized protein involved in exopolysaccharide biosynthesis